MYAENKTIMSEVFKKAEFAQVSKEIEKTKPTIVVSLKKLFSAECRQFYVL